MADDFDLVDAYAVETPDDNRDLYARWAATYESGFITDNGYRYHLGVAGAFLDVVRPDDGPVLDVGCGTGLVGAYLVGQGYSAIDGLDFSSEMLSQARSKRIYQKLLPGDLNTVLDIPDQTYDAGISCGTFTHGHVKADALDEIIRVLKPGACFVCTIHREVWQSAGFGTKFAQLTASGVAELESMNEQPFYRNAPADGRFCVIRRL